MNRTTCRHARGFTLIEVLATMILLAIVLPIAMRGVSIALAAAGNAKRTADAATLSQSKLNELVITNTWTNSGTTGDFGTGFAGYTWSLQSAAREFGLTELSLTTTWQEQGKAKSLTIATLVSDVGNGATAATGGTR